MTVLRTLSLYSVRFKIWWKRLPSSRVVLSLRGNYFLIVLGVTFCLLALESPWYAVVAGIYLVYLWRETRTLFLVFLVIMSLIGGHHYILDQRKIEPQEVVYGVIQSIEMQDNQNKLLVQGKDSSVLVYDYDVLNLRVGMKVVIRGKIMPIDSNRVEGGFNYQAYLNRMKIDWVMMAQEVDIVGKKFTVHVIRDAVEQYFNQNFTKNSRTFLKALIMGDDSGFNEDINNSLRINGTIHLFAISGSHITLFVGMLSYGLKRLKVKESKIELFLLAFLGFYMIITAFSPSIFRAALMYAFALLNQKKKLGLTGMDNASIVFLGMLLGNPYYFYQLGFALSFIVSFSLILSSEFSKKMSPVKQGLFISILAQIVALPLIVNINLSMNLLSFITNIVYIFMVETVILPVSIVVVFLPFLAYLYEYMITSFIESSFLFSRYFVIDLRFKEMKPLLVVAYFGCWIMILLFYYRPTLKRLGIGLLVCVIGIVTLASDVSLQGEVHFLDLYNGESIIITDSFSTCSAVIDTGDGRGNEVTQFLKRKGIKQLDYLILTHNHADHNGEAARILSEFSVSTVVVSAYDTSEYRNLINAVTVKRGDTLTCGKLSFEVLHPDQRYRDENDNSIVLYSTIGNQKFLFMGDATTAVEKDFYHLEVDVIKVGHHGSKTSTSSELIAALRPDVAIVQTGRVDKFGFPHREVIDVLKAYDVRILRTDERYSITYVFRKKKGIFKTMK